MSYELLYSVGGAALAAAAFGAISYFKNKKKDTLFKGFDKVKFSVSVVGAAIIAGAAAYSGVSPDVMANSAMAPLLYQALRKLFNTFL